MLLAGIMATSAAEVAPDLREDLMDVMDALGQGHRVVQPAVRHRFQTDRVGLTSSRQRLIADNGTLDFDFELDQAKPVQLALGAIYAAASLPDAVRLEVFEALNAALVWAAPVDARFVTMIMDGRVLAIDGLRAWNDPVAWALGVLDLDTFPGDAPPRRVVLRQFRRLLRSAHPDHGGVDNDAAARIAELAEARRILLSS